jgi:SAM-dependent methyltransferase
MNKDDSWELGEAYEIFMGRWSCPVAREFIRWLGPPPNGRWLDVGCGTGALSQTIGQIAAPQQIMGIDFSEGFIRHARQLYPEAVYDFQVGSALDLPGADDTFDVVVSGLALNFFPDPETAVRQMCRVVKRGGTVAIYVWDYAAGMEMLRYFWDAAVALDPQAATLDEGHRFPICQPEPLHTLLTQAGLDKVVVQTLETTVVFRDFADYWQPFLGQNGPAPSYVAALTPDQKIALADKLRQLLPIQPDGTIPLKMWAWAVRGVKA